VEDNTGIADIIDVENKAGVEAKASVEDKADVEDKASDGSIALYLLSQK
jgi:hypothetical protein